MSLIDEMGSTPEPNETEKHEAVDALAQEIAPMLGCTPEEGVAFARQKAAERVKADREALNADVAEHERQLAALTEKARQAAHALVTAKAAMDSCEPTDDGYEDCVRAHRAAIDVTEDLKKRAQTLKPKSAVLKERRADLAASEHKYECEIVRALRRAEEQAALTFFREALRQSEGPAIACRAYCEFVGDMPSGLAANVGREVTWAASQIGEARFWACENAGRVRDGDLIGERARAKWWEEARRSMSR